MVEQTLKSQLKEKWKTHKLQDSSTLKARIGWQGLTTSEYLKFGNFFLVTGTDFANGFIDWENCHYVDEKRYSQDTNIQLREEDVLVTKDGTIGKVAFVEKMKKPATLNSGVFVIRPRSNIYLPKFFYYILCSKYFEDFLNRLTAGSTISHLYQKDFIHFEFPLPQTKEEQSAIASLLSDTDALIESLDKLIVKKEHIKQGTMQELLTGKRRLPGFKGEWEVKKLGEIAYVTKLAGFEYTNYFNSYKDGGNIIVIRGTNITNNRLDLSDVKNIPRSTSNKLPRSKLSKDDLVFAYVGTIGPVYLIEDNDKYHLGPNTCKISAEDSVSPKFLFSYFTSWLINKEIVEQTSIGAQPSLSMTKIRSFKIIVPQLIAEQNAIAKIFSDMDAEIEELEQKRDKYNQIKTGMMQQLLTGKIRLI